MSYRYERGNRRRGHFGPDMMHKTTVSTWIATYILALADRALAAMIILIPAHHRHPTSDSQEQPFRSAVDRLIIESLPPRWTTRHSRYLTEIVGPDGNNRAFPYIGAGSHDRPLLVATDMASHTPTRTDRDLSDPTSPGRFKE